MKHRTIPFSPPDIGEREKQAVSEALSSGWITTGPRTKQFEKAISDYVGTNKTVCLNSATAAMELTLRVLGIGPGDEVIVPAYTYTASCSVICHVGAAPIMIDSQKDSVEMDYDAMEAAINEKTKAIIAVDVAGIVCDYERIYEAVDRKSGLYHADNDLQKAFQRVIVMSDCAHGFGAVRRGKRAGAIADFTCFSFHAVKNLTTAEGGAVTWIAHKGMDDEAVYKQYQLLSLHGQNKDALSKNKSGGWEYDIIAPYYKCNMTDIQASIGIVQLERYESMLKRRFEIIAMYDEAFKNDPIQCLQHQSDIHRSSGHLYFTRIDGMNEAQRNKFIESMAEKGVSCNVHYKPLPMLTAYKRMGFDIGNYPNAYRLYENEITLPLYSTLSDDDVKAVIQAYRECLEEAQCV